MKHSNNTMKQSNKNHIEKAARELVSTIVQCIEQRDFESADKYAVDAFYAIYYAAKNESWSVKDE